MIKKRFFLMIAFLIMLAGVPVFAQGPNNLDASIFDNGSLIKFANKIYVVQNGGKIHIRSLNELRSRFKGKTIVEVNNEIINRFPDVNSGTPGNVEDNFIVVNNFPLNNVGASTTASATADLRSFKRGNLDDVSIKIKVKNLTLPTGRVLEGWLVDNDSGYRLSLGAFRPDMNLDFKATLNNLTIYDRITVTDETERDVNPNPDVTLFQADMPSVIGEIKLRAFITGLREVPPTNSQGVGKGKFVLNTKDNTLSFDIRFSNLSGTETGAHIHGPAGVGQNADVLFTLPLGSPKIGVWHYEEALEDDILAGRTYVNIHSSVFGEGEIRGQIISL